MVARRSSTRNLLLILSSNTFLNRTSSHHFSRSGNIATTFINNSKCKSFSQTRFITKKIYTPSSAGINMVTMDSPSAQRNKGPIYTVIESEVLPLISSDDESQSLNALEVAAGCGVHSTYFVSKLAEKNLNVQWTPTDPDPPSLESLKQRVREFALPDDITSRVSINDPLSLSLVENGILEDDTREFFSDTSINFMICINMIHISPWTATLGLFKLANSILCSGGVLLTYGPYKENGTAVESNLSFDRSLKSRDPNWGVRDVEAVVKVANECGLSLKKTIRMPANNLSLIFVKN